MREIQSLLQLSGCDRLPWSDPRRMAAEAAQAAIQSGDPFMVRELMPPSATGFETGLAMGLAAGALAAQAGLSGAAEARAAAARFGAGPLSPEGATSEVVP
jgi:hypothetical protein